MSIREIRVKESSLFDFGLRTDCQGSRDSRKRSKFDQKLLTHCFTAENIALHTATKIVKMRTKNLLLSAAAVVAGALSVQAQQNVYSVNVVGYVNQVFPAGQLVCIANPLSDGTNTLNTVLPNFPAKSTAQFWTGSGFTPASKATTWSPDVSIPPGVGFFVNSKSAYTNTYVGAVSVASGASTTNSLPAGVLVLVGSPVPYAGDLNDTNLNLNLPAKSSAQFWNGAGYTPSSKATTWSPALPVAVGQGFFLNSKSAYNWVQTLPSN